ncbi:acyl-CoA thioesterase [Phaeacidiphilus oryzae]|uniref:acyl-CoA thioesterase n=1 Tax=Phaeacidiphilus oryzae TaxID=348818 RepID=UPI000560C8CC|nr:acyl-CoA thioesterase domain-containing protein [Phaeacidiphilus oryzae]
MASVTPMRSVPDHLTLPRLLELEQLDRDLYRGDTVFEEPHSLYGGQVAAQALMAAGRTVAPDRPPHSLHGYFLRAGDAGRPTVFRVDRDRDGRTFSARRVAAVQDGEVIFSLSASFQVEEEGREHVTEDLPDAPGPEGLPPTPVPRLFSFEARLPPQPYPDSRWPTRFWARCDAGLGDDRLLHSAVLTYLSDVFSGLSPLADQEWSSQSSLDHALWFHRPARLDDWVLLDMVPRTTGGGRGWYTGTITSPEGGLLASLAQETLFRRRRSARGVTST